MPFSKTSEQHSEQYWSTLFDTFLKPLIEEHPSVSAFRSAARREDLLSEILKNLAITQIVIADLTDFNPNVFWELGIRQSFKHGTITIAESNTSLPFDLGKKGTLFYHTRDTLANEQFRRLLRDAISDCLQNPDRPDSIVLETIGGRGSLFQIFRSEEVTRRIKSLKSELAYNRSTLSTTIEIAKENQSRRTKAAIEKDVPEVSFPVRKFRLSCIELLITNRYLDLLENFYEKAERYFDDLSTLNDQLIMWESSEESTEEYMLAQSQGYLNSFLAFQDSLYSSSAKVNVMPANQALKLTE
jgi:hypothetical protein